MINPRKCGLVLAILFAISVIFMLGYTVGYNQGDTKNYEAACLEADFIRYTIDHFDGDTACWNIGAEIKDCYYEWFGELDNGGFKTKYITDIRQFEDYYWCY